MLKLTECLIDGSARQKALALPANFSKVGIFVEYIKVFIYRIEKTKLETLLKMRMNGVI